MTKAIVIGGGVAGLLTARILTHHFEHVTIIERDVYPEKPEHRPGTPQDRQVHTMLLRGQRELERLFPGLKKKLLAAGAVERDYGSESLNFYGGARCPKIPSPLHGWNASRMLVEWFIRQEVLHSPQVQALENYEVVNLLADDGKERVTGVLVRARGQTHVGETKLLEGDFVVDASGAGSQAPQWLVEMEYPLVEEKAINPQLGYATRFYQADELPWKNVAIQATEGKQRGGVLMEIEKRQWMVVLAGSGGDHPPTEEEGYLAFAQSLPDTAIFEAIKGAQPLSPIYGYRRTENRWRHFERMKRWPEGFIVIGDATCVFNPIYGQGMTIALLEAIDLDTSLRQRGLARNFARNFQKRVARIITLPWLLAASSDARALKGKRANPYIEHLIRLLPQDHQVLQLFLEVIHMLRSPLALFHPLIVTKIVFHWRQRR